MANSTQQELPQFVEPIALEDEIFREPTPFEKEIDEVSRFNIVSVLA